MAEWTFYRRTSLIQRKELLKEALTETDAIKYCDHIPEKGIAFLNR
jgi:bifunctional non-homologous end joining protein LigD